jgi:polygalacturonase
LIEFMWSTALEVSWLKLVQSPFWTVHPVYCQGFYAHHLTILNDLHSPNTDGIDPDSTTDVVLAHNYIKTGDDCYALKSGWDAAGYTYAKPTRNVSIYGGYCESPTR